jgi:uncharacterized protein
MWWTALLMGLAGSLHCAGMCSPLAMAITMQKPLLANKIIYNTGRIITYGILGAIAAALGSSFFITPYQSVISFSIGVIFLLTGIGAITGIHIPIFTNAINRLTHWLKGLFAFWLQRKNYLSVMIMGMLNGLLPCGLTYLAMTYCFIMPNAQEGFGFMILFGLGTWPVMIGFTWVLGVGFAKVKLNYQKITMVVFILIGAWLLTRAVTTHQMDAHQHLFGQTHTEEVLCQ